MPWATVASNVSLPLESARYGRRGGRRARRRRAPAGRARRLRACLSARALRRHEDARLDRARAGHRAGAPADGRAVRGARRDHPLQAQRRPASRSGARSSKTVVFVTHSVFESVYLSAAHRGDDAAARPRVHRTADRRALSARQGLPHLGGIRSAVPAGLRGAGGGAPPRQAHEREQRSRHARAQPRRGCAAHPAAGRGAGARRAGLGPGRAAARYPALCAAGAGCWCSRP